MPEKTLFKIDRRTLTHNGELQLLALTASTEHDEQISDVMTLFTADFEAIAKNGEGRLSIVDSARIQYKVEGKSLDQVKTSEALVELADLIARHSSDKDYNQEDSIDDTTRNSDLPDSDS